MDINSKVRISLIKEMITKDILDIHNRFFEVKKSIQDNLQDVLDYFYDLRAQIPESTSGPLITQTPKASRNRGICRINSIREDVAVNNTISNSARIYTEKQKVEVKSGCSKREASIKAANTIKKQQLLKLSTKLRRPSNYDEQSVNVTKNNHERRGKRKQSARSSSTEEDSSGPMKQIKVDGGIPRVATGKKLMDSDIQNDHTTTEQNISPQGKVNATMMLCCTNQKGSFTQSLNMNGKLGSKIGDMAIMDITDDVEELSMYEDAIEKPSSIMSSTVNCNSTIAIHNMIDATVVLNRLSEIKVNETITIKKNSGTSTERSDRKNQLTLPPVDSSYTDSSSSSSEYEVPCTPSETVTKGVNTGSAIVHNIRNKFKPNTVVSPYAKEAVEKRIAAFDEAKMNSPQSNVEVEAPIRITRTKMRAIAAAREEAAKHANRGITVSQKIARKSLAKAKTSLIKRAKQIDNHKENIIQAAQRIQKQQKTTSLQKIKTQLPMSVNRIAHTPVNDQYNFNLNKAPSVARTNNIISTDSFLHVPKIANKSNFTQKMEEVKRKVNNDDAKRKKEEALRLQIEEERRKRREKELKNKIAREIKYKQDMEMAAKEKEEKVHLVKQMQEKQREELKKKRLVQNQCVNREGNTNQHPTNYILDSEPNDDESDYESRPKHRIPYWAQPETCKAYLSLQRYIPERAVFRFFDTRKCTPDLAQLFQGIDRRKLQRTSSAIWKTPPRYSMMEAE